MNGVLPHFPTRPTNRTEETVVRWKCVALAEVPRTIGRVFFD
jgi:hypothetical protein